MWWWLSCVVVFLLARDVAAEGLGFEPVYDDEDAVTC